MPHTESGLCKSTDGGDHWQLLPQSGGKELTDHRRKGKSIRGVAVDPADGNVVYAVPPARCIRAPTAARRWKLVYEKKTAGETEYCASSRQGQPGLARGIWLPLSSPKGVPPRIASGSASHSKATASRPAMLC